MRSIKSTGEADQWRPICISIDNINENSKHG